MHPLAIFSVVGFALVGDGHRKARGFTKGGKAPLWGQGATPLQEGNSSAFPCHAEGWHRGSRYDIAILLPLPPWPTSVEKVRRKASRFLLHFAALVGWINGSRWGSVQGAVPPVFSFTPALLQAWPRRAGERKNGRLWLNNCTNFVRWLTMNKKRCDCTVTPNNYFISHEPVISLEITGLK